MAYHPFRHPGLKIVSVAIALALWFAVAGEQVVERSLRIPVELQNMPQGLELVDNPPATVDVRVRGASGQLSQLTSSDVVAIVDLSTARSGRKFFHLTRADVRVPFGVEVTQVSPGTVSLFFERSASRTVAVVPAVEGQPAQGYQVASVACDPSEVTVRGPESALRHLKEAVTEPVSVAGAAASVRERVNIGVADPALHLDQASAATVLVEIVPVPVQRALMSVPVRTRNLGPRLSAQLAPTIVSVLTRGPKDRLDALRADSVTAYVDLAGLGVGRYNLSVRVEPLRDAVVIRTDPATVRVRIGR